MPTRDTPGVDERVFPGPRGAPGRPEPPAQAVESDA